MNIDHVWLPYTQMQTAIPPWKINAAKGSKLFLVNGQELVDGVSSWWTACHGYAHPEIIQRATQQLEQLPHIMLGGLIHPQTELLASRLAKLLPGDLQHVFFSDSGSVAVEVAMKMATQYWMNLGINTRNKFICFYDGYHGDTYAAMSVCDPEEGMHHMFKDSIAKQHLTTIPRSQEQLNQFEDFVIKHRDTTAAVIIEPLVQGAGGMKMYPEHILAKIAEICQKHRILLILDEIFTGFARTGKMFACEHAGIVPDIICLSKALSAGTVPLAATVATQEIYQSFLSNDPEKALMHGPTFMGNPLACACANASLDLFEQIDWQHSVAEIEQHLLEHLEPCRSMQKVVDVRVLGAIGVVQLTKDIDIPWLKEQFMQQGVWLRPFRDIVYTTPALNISKPDLTKITSAITATISRWSTKE